MNPTSTENSTTSVSTNIPAAPAASVSPPPTPVSPTSPSAPPPSEEKVEEQVERKMLKPVAFALIAVTGVLILLTIGLVVFGQSNKTIHDISQQVIPPQILPDDTPTPTPAPAPAIVSGSIVFQGYSDPEAYLVIVERPVGKTDFKSVVTGLVPTTGSIPFTWKDADSGTNYEIEAQLKVRGITIQSSTPVIVSAPASNVTLGIVSEQNPPTPAPAAVGGNTNINGYIPAGSTLTITAQGSTGGPQTIVTTAATDDAAWTWNSAISGETYNLTAVLASGGTVIATSVPQNVTAPSSGLTFDLNSTAQPPAPAIVGVSGTINLNGNIPANSYITLGTRVTGSTSFNQVGSNLNATNGVAWSWSSAQSGTSYDVQAYLWANGKPYSASNIMTNVAPADGITLTINAQQSLAAPAQNTLNVSCNGVQNNQYQITINYNTNAALQGVSSYQVVVTQASFGNQVINTTMTPGNNPNQQQTLTTGYQFTSGATYYAQYAYSASGTGFSPLSPSVQFSCN